MGARMSWYIYPSYGGYTHSGFSLSLSKCYRLSGAMSSTPQLYWQTVMPSASLVNTQSEAHVISEVISVQHTEKHGASRILSFTTALFSIRSCKLWLLGSKSVNDYRLDNKN